MTENSPKTCNHEWYKVDEWDNHNGEDEYKLADWACMLCPAVETRFA